MLLLVRTAYDIQSGFSGTFFNNTSTTTGVVGNSFLFHGTSDYIEIHNFDFLQTLSSGTFEFWLRLDETPSTPTPCASGQPCNVVISARSAFTFWVAASSSLAVEVDFAAGFPKIQADSARLERVLNLLVSNAVAFNHPSGEIRILGRNGNGNVRLELGNTGAAIPAEDLDRVFQPFKQVERYLTRRTGGLGLGLSIAKKVVEAHGGSLGISSEPGKGVTVTLSLPVSPSLDQGQGEKASQAPDFGMDGGLIP